MTLEGAEALGRADLLAKGAIWGCCSKPINDEVFIGVGNAGLATPFGLCAIAKEPQEFSPSAWPRIKPNTVSLERRKRVGVIKFVYFKGA